MKTGICLLVLIFVVCVAVCVDGRGRGGGGRSSRGGWGRGSRGSSRYRGTRSISFRRAAVAGGTLYASRYYRVRYNSNPSYVATICYNSVDLAPEINDTFSNGTLIYNSNRTRVYGFFLCPMTNNADNVYCCGYNQREYCCTFWEDAGRVIGAVVGILIGIFVGVSLIFIGMNFLLKSAPCKKCMNQTKQCCGIQDRSNSVSSPAFDDPIHNSSVYWDPKSNVTINPQSRLSLRPTSANPTATIMTPPPSYEAATGMSMTQVTS